MIEKDMIFKFPMMSFLADFSFRRCVLLHGLPQVLRDEIGTAVTNKKSRTESSCMARKGRGSTKSDFSRKRVSRCV